MSSTILRTSVWSIYLRRQQRVPQTGSAWGPGIPCAVRGPGLCLRSGSFGVRSLPVDSGRRVHRARSRTCNSRFRREHVRPGRTADLRAVAVRRLPSAGACHDCEFGQPRLGIGCLVLVASKTSLGFARSAISPHSCRFALVVSVVKGLPPSPPLTNRAGLFHNGGMRCIDRSAFGVARLRRLAG